VPARLLVISDTHVRPDTVDRVPAVVWEYAESATAILHAGDVVCGELLDRLSLCGPLHVVLGNNDVGLLDDLPEVVEFDIDGVSIAMTHDSGARKGRERRMRRRFPDADLVVFGHSHEPIDVIGEEGQRLLNPGSPTQRRRQPQCSFALAEIDGDSISTEIVLLG
jgi:uncharacterized protein